MKVREKSVAKNYFSVSLLSVTSKITRKAVKINLLKFRKCDFFSDPKYDFRPSCFSLIWVGGREYYFYLPPMLVFS